MSVNPDIHDRAYQFFIEEAIELLQIIEDGILELRKDRGASTVHAVMRAAHSIKGGAASVELEAIKVISHRLETAFRALYDETVEIDDVLEGLLLQGYDCLQEPLNEQIETGSHDPEAALAKAMPVIEAIEAHLGPEALQQADSFIPSSSDLGVDMVTSIFEIDVEEGIVHLEAVAANPSAYPVLGELQAQAEVFVGFGELLELPGFGAIAQAILDACHSPQQVDALELLGIALADLQAARDLVMGGDRKAGGSPSAELLALAAASADSNPVSQLTGAGEGDWDTSAFLALDEDSLADFGLEGVDLSSFDLSEAGFEEAAVSRPAGEAIAPEEGLDFDQPPLDSLSAMAQLAGLMADEMEEAPAPLGESSPAIAGSDPEADLAEGSFLDSIWGDQADTSSDEPSNTASDAPGEATEPLDMLAQLDDAMAAAMDDSSEVLPHPEPETAARTDCHDPEASLDLSFDDDAQLSSARPGSDPWLNPAGGNSAADVDEARAEAASFQDDATFIQGPDDIAFIEVQERGEVDLANLVPGPITDSITDSILGPTGDCWGEGADSTAGEASAAATDLQASPAESFEQGTFIQSWDEGTFIQTDSPEWVAPEIDGSGAAEVDRDERFDEGTFVQEYDEGTFIQGIDEGTWIQDLDATVVQGAIVRDTAMQGEGAETAADASTATDEGDGINPELAAFIAQAAAESARQVAQGKFAQGKSNSDSPTESLPDSPGDTPRGSSLPSLETMFSNATSVLDDSLVQQPGELDARLEGSPEPQPEAVSDLAAEEASAMPEAAAIPEAPATETGDLPGEGDSSEGLQSDRPEASSADHHGTGNSPFTDTAVQVALAEHQALPPDSAKTPALGEIVQPPLQTSAEIAAAVQAAEQLFNQLPGLNQSAAPTPLQATPGDGPAEALASTSAKSSAKSQKKQRATAKLSGISVRVDLSVLERMNNLVGELVLNRNSLSLQQEQLQFVVTQLAKRFNGFETNLNGLRQVSDQMLVASGQNRSETHRPSRGSADSSASALGNPFASSLVSPAEQEDRALLDGFDALEMDRYNALHGQLQNIFEELMQLEEGVDDIGVLLEQSTQSLTQQRQRLSLLQNELMWARMLPLDNILGRFPRLLRDMASKHGKSVDLSLNGTSVLVDKGILEKLHDPMLHLLRNAFDHGIETPAVRQQQGKPKQGEIQINAYYQGNQTIIEIKDDGQGINLERIAKRAIELGWLSREEISSIPQQALIDLIFEPGFSTAAALSELSGRGVGLDVVREQLKGLKGNVTVSYEKGKGTTFTLRLPLTLTVAKLMVCQVGSSAIALPSDGIEDLLVPTSDKVKLVGHQRFLHWRNELIPIQPMADLLGYNCPLPDISALKSLTSSSIPVPQDWAMPLLIFSRGQQRCALEVNRLLMEQELVIKPFSAAMTPPEYSYGCTILGDGRMIPVLDGMALLQQLTDNSVAATGLHLADDVILEETEGAAGETTPPDMTMVEAMQVRTILVVDDSTAMRRTMALSLEKAGYRVVQAGDGQEALTQLRQSKAIQLVICDVEMPNMNGFEFLSQRRREPQLMEVPVVMLTSRSSDKHRRLAKQLKAQDYFSKPYVEQEFLKSIQEILRARSPQGSPV